MYISETDMILNPDGSVYHLGLLPQQVSDNIIFVGDPGRVQRISQHFDHLEHEVTKREFITHTGTYKGTRVTAMSTGMGTDNIEIAMIELDALFNIDLQTRRLKENPVTLHIVRIGTSGSIRKEIEPGTVLGAKYGVGLDIYNTHYLMPQDEFEQEIAGALKKNLQLQYDPYCLKGSEKLINKIAFDIPIGNTVTTPGFYAAQGRQLRIPLRNNTYLKKLLSFNHKGFKLSNVEMETSTIYGFARLMGHEALSINAILANRVQKKFFMDTHKPIDSIIEMVLERL